MPKLLLLDGHSLAYRAFFALPADMATASGTFTNAVYGFTSMLTKVLADEKPDFVAVAFDTPKPTFRDEMDEHYKEGRAETPDLFISQLPLIREVLDVVGIPVLEIEGVEADDVIATLATQAKDNTIDTVIVTGDRDSYQLVSDPHVKVLYNKRGVSDYALYDEAGILERTGVHPKQYTNYAALRGDASDNLPGVPGIGEKTAAKLIQSYGDLEGIYDHIDEMSPKQKSNLIEYKDQAFHNRKMMELVRNVEVGLPVEKLTIEVSDVEAIRTLFNQLEFRTLFDRFLDAIGTKSKEPVALQRFDVSVEIISNPSDAVERLRALTAGDKTFGVATELGAEREIISVALTEDSTTAFFLDVSCTANAEVQSALGSLFSTKGGKVVAHGAKSLFGHFSEMQPDSLLADTGVLAYLLDPGERDLSIQTVANKYGGLMVDEASADPGTLDFNGIATAEALGRAACASLAIADTLIEAVKSRSQYELWREFELPLIAVLARMEKTGVLVDVELLAQMRKEISERQSTIESKIFTLAGETFNINSTQQLRVVLFEKLGLTPVKKTKTGPSTDADSLQKLAKEHPIVEQILAYREVEKLRSTYIEPLPALVKADGRIHATFNQTVTTTGRISSESPNLQNIPIRSAEGALIRKAFIAKPGFGLLSADYSQIELRLLAHMSGDPGLLDAFDRNADVHTATAAMVFGVPEEKVDETQRRFAKVVNYGLAYGMEAFGLASRMDIPTDEAKQILDAYFASFSRVSDFMEQTVAHARKDGFTTTIFGRRRMIPELSSSNFRIRQMGERMAQNAPLQGSAADIFKLAMIRCSQLLQDSNSEASIILTVHDELVFEIETQSRAGLEPQIVEAMGGVAELRVPLLVDTGFGINWGEAKAEH